MADSFSSPLEVLDGDREVDRILRSSDDFYSVLCTTRSVDLEGLKTNYKRLALKVHPDKNQNPRSSDAFKLLGEAFTCLSDPVSRRKYDICGTTDPDLFTRSTEFNNQMKIVLVAELYKSLSSSLFSSLFSGGGGGGEPNFQKPQRQHPFFGSVTGYERQQPPDFGSVTGYGRQQSADFGSVAGYGRQQSPDFGPVTGYKRQQPSTFGSVTGYR
eukprot:TRINITY_DN1108_c0_g2_i12.p1 TRINITY_DN1108_c0_g2~~TRINITY_DN1108_c0_g2_i12.p1  ORF type:complete len:214 (-),score=49.78 TRINITY_DN1108_c0_g2_i12:381-1022(-)